MIFLADESVDRPIVEGLRQEGHKVWYVAEMEPGIADDVVLATANQEAALLLTADKDFGELVFRRRLHAHGIVLIRLAGLLPERKAAIVASVVRQHASELTGALTVIAPGLCRIRRFG